MQQHHIRHGDGACMMRDHALDEIAVGLAAIGDGHVAMHGLGRGLIGPGCGTRGRGGRGMATVLPLRPDQGGGRGHDGRGENDVFHARHQAPSHNGKVKRHQRPARIAVVERPGSNSASSSRPPWARTSGQPTTVSAV